VQRSHAPRPAASDARPLPAPARDGVLRRRPALPGGGGRALASRPNDRDRLRAIARRFGWGTLAAITVLIGTGIPLASHFHQWESGTLQVKLALVAVVAGLVVRHMRRPQVHALEGAIFVGSLAIMWLGVSLAH
jgi:hypothetical protein